MNRNAFWLAVLSLVTTILISSLICAADVVNINTANIEELKTLQGIGEVRADAIIKYRQIHGPFQSVDELKNVTGIGDKIVEANRSNMTLEQVTTEAEKSRAKSDDVMVNTKH
ncbi:ComEA family DNA-binding protein [Candidatus Entotheonella palauensis]|uniref:Helix-hairpin-helix DNA-binding motif class 1 domain-containing protein n=1 Tax=Candidatus Entotheonella gemina TaxID=1429439 RepID=W4LSN5_9BACT|nr:ComEA family DNA-binding protein [Candidatus Entotheonella palauensis]ETX00865.1 MAG: hypothetical protein ETSY2_38305 [Candidatus Entotheonella gemina]